jgi:hypothetical protein
MIGALLIAAIALTGNYGGPVASGGASCGATTVPVLELGSVVCEAPSQILSQPTLFEPQVGYGYTGVLSPWVSAFNGAPFGGQYYGGSFGGGRFGGGHWGGGHGHCTTSTTGGVTTRTCT